MEEEGGTLRGSWRCSLEMKGVGVGRVRDKLVNCTGQGLGVGSGMESSSLSALTACAFCSHNHQGLVGLWGSFNFSPLQLR